MRWQPALRTLPPYYDDPLYIDALRANLTRQLAALDFEPERLLLSFHGMPQRTLDLGDPYHCHCQKTARLLGEALGREVDVAFQSQVRPREVARARDRRDAGRLSEQGRQARRDRRAGLFRRLHRDARGARDPRPRDVSPGAAASSFALLDCLNDSPEGIDMLNGLVAPRTCRLASHAA